MITRLTLLLPLLALLAFKPNPRIESVVRTYAEKKLGKLQAFQLYRVDTLTPRLRLALHQSRITDSLVILQPLLEYLVKYEAETRESANLYPKEPAFSKALVDISKQLSDLKSVLAGMVQRGNALDSAMLQVDSTTFTGYLTQAAVKYYEGGNRALTVYDTATVLLTPTLEVIEKQNW